MRIRKEGTKSEANASETPRISREQRRDPNTHSQENRQNRSKDKRTGNRSNPVDGRRIRGALCEWLRSQPCNFFYGTVLGK